MKSLQIILLYLTTLPVIGSYCPRQCNCINAKKYPSETVQTGLKLRCGGDPSNKIINLDEIEFANIREDVVQLYVLITESISNFLPFVFIVNSQGPE